MSPRAASAAWRSTTAASIRSGRSSILPCAMRETSSRSSTSRARWLACRPMTSRAHADLLGVLRGRRDAGGAGGRGERVAQLVGEHREELVLAAVGLAQLAVQPGGLDDAGRLPGVELDQADLALARAVGLAEEGRDEAPAAAPSRLVSGTAKTPRKPPSRPGSRDGSPAASASTSGTMTQPCSATRPPGGRHDGGHAAVALQVLVGQADAGGDLQVAPLAVAEPDQADLGPHHAHGRRQDLLQRRLQPRRGRQLGADPVQVAQVRELLGQRGLGLVELPLDPLAPGDVPHQAAQAERPALVVADDAGGLADPDRAAVDRLGPVFQLEVAAVGHPAPAGLAGVLAVVGDDAVEPGVGHGRPAAARVRRTTPRPAG